MKDYTALGWRDQDIWVEGQASLYADRLRPQSLWTKWNQIIISTHRRP